jgi:hypothetical protein
MLLSQLQVAESAAVLIGSTEGGAVALEAMHSVRTICLHALICYLVGSDVLTAYPELLQDFMQLQVNGFATVLVTVYTAESKQFSCT